MSFCENYSPYFRAARHDLSEKAHNYLSGLMMKAERKNMERMEDYVSEYNYQGQQQFLSDSPWEHEPLLARIGKDVDELLGGADSMLLIDESGFAKKGTKSVGVARQWNGRMGKVDNCQVGVFAALSDGTHCAPVDLRLFLPQAWTDDVQRCEEAKIPQEHREHKTKPELAWEMIEGARDNSLRFGWVGLDSLYGNAPHLLRKIEDAGLLYCADVHCDQRVFLEDPNPKLPKAKSTKGRPPSRLQTSSKDIRVDELFARSGRWSKVSVRNSTKGAIAVKARALRVWLWDGKEESPRQVWVACIIDSDSGQRKYFLSNAPAESSLATLVRRHATRYWIERSFQDAKTSVGMADYQARGWLAWHHHMALVLLAMLFMLRQRIEHAETIELLSCQDIVELLNVYLPRADRTKEAVLRNIERRHRKRKEAIEYARGKKPFANPRT
jgi:SRSO17 transposase